MTPLLCAVAILGIAALVVLCLPRTAGKAIGAIGTAATVVAALLGATAALGSLRFGTTETYSLPWRALPDFPWSFGIDPLGGAFLCLVFVVPALTAPALAAWLSPQRCEASPGRIWGAFLILTAAMAGVTTARNGPTFLVAWETMTVAAYFLLAPHSGRRDVERPARLFLGGAHLGIAFLAPAFVLLDLHYGVSEFGAWSVRAGSVAFPATTATAVFVCALVGFGLKLGLLPLHVWLPDTYSAAPGPLPAVLSGAMAKMGLYGFLRVLSFLPVGPAWWPTLLILLGVGTALWGIAAAVLQADLKRLLAFSSIEHAGIFFLGIGSALICRHRSDPHLHALEMVCWAAVVLHAWNHALAKSLLFMGCGAIEQAAGHTDIDRLGGILKELPIVSTAFIVGAAAICGLPPLGVFAGEFLVYLVNLALGLARFPAAAGTPTLASWTQILLPWLLIGGLALTGGIAAYAFAKAVGQPLLGAAREPRGKLALPRAAQFPCAIAAIALVLLGLTAPWAIEVLMPAASVVAGHGPERNAEAIAAYARVDGALRNLTVAAVCFWGLLGGLLAFRAYLLTGREVTESETWGCGYVEPSPRRQYSGQSFAHSATALWGSALGAERNEVVFTEYFPQKSQRPETRLRDRFLTDLYEPFFAYLLSWAQYGKAMQQGRIQTYVAYIVGTLLFLLIVRSTLLGP